MQVRTQLALIGVIAAGWAAGNFTVVRPLLAESPQLQRESLARLESIVARDHDNAQAARALSSRYLELEMPRLALETVGRMSRGVQDDGRVSLNVAKAHEMLGEIDTASARMSGALNRCTQMPSELAAGAGCDVRTKTELAIELEAVDRMRNWHVTPLSDPQRAEEAHELALRPIRIAGTIH